MNFDQNPGIPGKPFEVLKNSGIPQGFESGSFEILHKLLLLSFLEILKFLGTQFSILQLGGGGGRLDILWNSPINLEMCSSFAVNIDVCVGENHFKLGGSGSYENI